MTDITPEQRAAVEWLREKLKGKMSISEDQHIRALLEALPAELTNPQPELPSEPGPYLDGDGTFWWYEHASGWQNMNGHHSDAGARQFAPFTRLVPERPTITREQVRAAVGRVLTNIGNYPDAVSHHLISQDFSGVIAKTSDAVLALVNGKGAES